MKIYDKAYTPEDLEATGALPLATYENCTFTGLQLAGSQLSSFRFLECTFRSCDLSNAVLGGTALQEVVFEDCKLLGLNFADASQFLLQLRFLRCKLDHATFAGVNLKGTDFGQSRLYETDVTEADLSEADLSGCDLERAVFDRSTLIGADLRHALHLDIDPEFNRMQNARLSPDGLVGLLRKFGLRVGE